MHKATKKKKGKSIKRELDAIIKKVEETLDYKKTVKTGSRY